MAPTLAKFLVFCLFFGETFFPILKWFVPVENALDGRGKRKQKTSAVAD